MPHFPHTPTRFGAVHVFSHQESKQLQEVMDRAAQNSVVTSNMPLGTPNPLSMGYLAAKTGELSLLDGIRNFEIDTLPDGRALVVTNTETPDLKDLMEAGKNLVERAKTGESFNYKGERAKINMGLVDQAIREHRLNRIG